MSDNKQAHQNSRNENPQPVHEPPSVHVTIYTRRPTAEDQEALRSYLQQRPRWRVTHRFSDPWASGNTTNRPGLQEALQSVSEEPTDVLLVPHIHSLSRNVRHLSQLIRELDSHSVALHSACDNAFVDTSTPTGQLSMKLLHTFADWEENAARDDRRRAVQKHRQTQA